MQSMDEKLTQHDELLIKLRNRQLTLTAAQHGIQGTLELPLQRINVTERGQARGDAILPLPVKDARSARPNHIHVPTPKWELPSFEGSNPNVWIRKCERYFSLYRIDDARRSRVQLFTRMEMQRFGIIPCYCVEVQSLGTN